MKKIILSCLGFTVFMLVFGVVGYWWAGGFRQDSPAIPNETIAQTAIEPSQPPSNSSNMSEVNAPGSIISIGDPILIETVVDSPVFGNRQTEALSNENGKAFKLTWNGKTVTGVVPAGFSLESDKGDFVAGEKATIGSGTFRVVSKDVPTTVYKNGVSTETKTETAKSTSSNTTTVTKKTSPANDSAKSAVKPKATPEAKKEITAPTFGGVTAIKAGDNKFTIAWDEKRGTITGTVPTGYTVNCDSLETKAGPGSNLTFGSATFWYEGDQAAKTAAVNNVTAQQKAAPSTPVKDSTTASYPETKSFFGRDAKHLDNGIYAIDWNNQMITGTIPVGYTADTDTQGTIAAGTKFSCGSMTLKPVK